MCLMVESQPPVTTDFHELSTSGPHLFAIGLKFQRNAARGEQTRRASTSDCVVLKHSFAYMQSNKHSPVRFAMHTCNISHAFASNQIGTWSVHLPDRAPAWPTWTIHAHRNTHMLDTSRLGSSCLYVFAGSPSLCGRRRQCGAP